MNEPIGPTLQRGIHHFTPEACIDNILTRDALADPELEWVAMLLQDLKRVEDSIYREKLAEKIDQMLGTFTINMTPHNYRRLYRDKTFR